jgi:predicted permease
MQSFANQIRQILRRLGRAPMFTGVALLTIAIGVGANTAVFSVVDGVLLKPLPYPHPDELVFVSHTAPGIGVKDLSASPSTYFIYREQNRTFEDVGLYEGDSVGVTGLAQPEQIPAVDVTDGILPILGIQPMLGRFFTRADDSPGSPKTLLLSYGFWNRKFGGDSHVVGRTLVVDGESREIIGVMPQRFRFLTEQEEPQMFLPIQLNREKTILGQFHYFSIARLKPGATIPQASADMARMLPIVLRSFPPPPGYSLDMFTHARIGPIVQPLKSAVVGDIGGVLWLLMGGIGLVLLIACANVANLLLVRTEGRQHELAVRAALGASRGRIASELFLESLVLAVLGSALGLGLAYLTLPALIALAPAGLPRADEIGINAPVLLFACAAALLASLLAASLPIFKYVGAHLGTGLRESGRTLSETRERHRARSALVIAQVALAFVLLICSGLMIRTFRALINVQPGFSDAAGIQTFSISIPSADVFEGVQVVRLQDAIRQRIEAVPGVSSAGFGTAVPMGGNSWNDPVFVENHPLPAGQLQPLRRFKFISPGYFASLGTPLLAGRDYTWADLYNKLPVAIVDESLARLISPAAGSDPSAVLGQRIRVSSVDDWRQVIGVVGDVHQDGVNKDAPATAYWPAMAANLESNALMIQRDVIFTVRSPIAGSAGLMDEIRRAVWSADPNLPVADVHTLQYFYKRSLAQTSFTLIMLAIAGGMAFLLGVVGLYGVIAYSVTQRTREIGIRMALGAQRDDVTRMFVRHGLMLVSIGVACGLAGAAVTISLMKSLLFHVKPSDPMTYLAVSTGLIATAVVASYIPSRRAAKVDPSEALRAE